MANASIFPSSKEIWDSQYRSGDWDYLRDIDEVGRYSITFGLLLYAGCHKRVLDIGCGEAIFLDYLRCAGYERYVGIDISPVAIAKNTVLADEKTEFFAVDIEEYSPLGQFDAIIFNECLYYLKDPLDIIQSCTHTLRSEGVFIVSLFLSQPDVAELRLRIRRQYRCLEEVIIRNRRGSWSCCMFGCVQAGVIADMG